MRTWPHRLTFALAVLLFALGLARDRFDVWVAATVLPPLAIETSVEVVDAEGRLLRAFTVDDGRWRLETSLDAVDPRYVAMLLAYEDKRFWRHDGVDPWAVGRALWQAVRAGEVVSGASTLTMQVARLMEEGPTGSWRGKLRQARLALALERRLTKDDILTLYVNRAPFGGNVEGVRAAALTWFGKPPHRLTPAEAALLIALPQAPVARRPDRHTVAAQAARDRVIGRLEASGVVTSEAAQAARATPVPRMRQPMPVHAPHLADRLQAEDPGAGLIATTLDRDAQIRMADLARKTLQGRDAHLSIAIVAADHRTGRIQAHVGAASYDDVRRGYIDMSQALRSPGSTLKPLIYGLAFDAGLAHPETLIADRPTDFGGWRPQNFDGRFRGDVRVAEALRLSLNLPAVLLTEALGPARLVAAMERAGMAPVIPGGRAGLAVSLGGVGVTLEDLVALYAGLANGGTAVPLTALPNDGDVGARLMRPEAAWQVGRVLLDLAPPSGAPARALAWKTGTSYGHRDAWALGWDGRHVVGVWIGRPDGTPVPGAFGADLAAPVLFEAFTRLAPTFTPLPPPPPGTLTVGHAALPAPLRRFGPDIDGAPRPTIAFPPEGARLQALDGLAVKVRDGVPPFTWLANGAPVSTGERRRDAWLDLAGPGFVTLSVIDGAGRSSRVRIRLD